MTLLSVKAVDFCCFSEFELPLKQRGLVWIGGSNADSTGAASNGSGKSTVFKAIGWGAYGKAIDGADGDEVIRSGAKRALVEISFEGGWKVVRERLKGSPRLKVLHDGKPLSLDKAGAQAKVDALMGMSWDAFRHVVLYGQRDTKRFIHPETKDADRKRVLQEILQARVWSTAHEAVKRMARESEARAVALQAGLDTALARAAEHDLDALEERAEEWERNRASDVKGALLEAKEAGARAKRLMSLAPDVSALEARLAELQDARRARQGLKDAVSAASSELVKAEALEERMEERVERAWRERNEAEKAIKDLSGDKCPTCGGSINEENLAAHKAELEAGLEGLDAKKDAAANARMAASEKAGEARKALEKARKALEASPASDDEEMDELSEEIRKARSARERARDAAAQARSAVARVKSLKKRSNPFEEQIAVSKSKIAAAEKAAAVARESLKAVSEELAYYEFWVKGFGPAGLPSFELDEVMPFLTERANAYLETLADGDITMVFSTQSELKSSKGEFRDKIAVNWEIEGVAGYPPSGGQWKKMELSTDFALMDLVETRAHVAAPLLLLDECLDGLDAEGVQRVLALLHKLRSKRGSVFVITHDSDLSDVFERGYIVEKKGGASRLRVAA